MQVLDVILVPDHTIRPPGPKMVVCISPDRGWYFRINTRDYHSPCVPLIRVPDNMFLHHDSFLECNIFDLDDYVIDEALRHKGIIGTVSNQICNPIRQAIRDNRKMSNTDKAVIHQIMQATAR